MKGPVGVRTLWVCVVMLLIVHDMSIAQKRGMKKAEFFPEKVIITDSDDKGKSTAITIEAPKGYTAIRGDGFTDAFCLSKFDRAGDSTQILPVVNLSKKALHHYSTSYLGRDTIQLPDKIIAVVDHFSVNVKETFGPGIQHEMWIDDRGYLVLSTLRSCEAPWVGAWVIFQESYEKEKMKGKTSDIVNGQYTGSTAWEVADSLPELFTNIK